MIYITGDTHGRFDRVFQFCKQHKTTWDDVLIILGDAGINYWDDIRDSVLKQRLSELPITLFCIHGNHERRPQTLAHYECDVFHDGVVYVEPEYPNILFAMDGQVYKFAGKHCMAIGGAYSVDKYYRLERGMNWFDDEQPDARVKERVERKIFEKRVDMFLTHTCPFKYIPTEVFLPQIDQSTVDNSTERWLDGIEDAVEYEKWYCGHYHTEKTIDRMRFMFNDFVMLGE